MTVGVMLPVGTKVKCIDGNGRLRAGVEYEIIGHRSAAPFRFEAYVVRDSYGNVYHGLVGRFKPVEPAPAEVGGALVGVAGVS